MPLNSPTHEQPSGKGILYVVATPLGNLEDMTYRAVRILSEVGLIAAEDTRQTLKLLNHFNIRNRLVSCHEHNEQAKASSLVQELLEGRNIALVTDSGTPLVSDPGFRLVAAALEAGVQVTPLPGACAAVTALSASGLPTDRFLFCGFLPKKSGKLRESLDQLAPESATLVFYESPRRITALVEAMAAAWGGRQAVLARELTKIHEEFIRGDLPGILAQLRAREEVRGECTLIVAGAQQEQAVDKEQMLREIEEGLAAGDFSVSKLATKLAKKYGLAKRQVYDMALHMQDRKTLT